MKIRFYNARVLTMKENEPIFHGEVWTQDERILYVGEESDVCGKDSQLGFDEEIDCNGNVLMPGFKNAHTHSAMVLLRSYADDLPLLDWLHKQVFPVEGKMTGEDVYDLTKLAILEYLTSGITAIFEMYIHPDMIAKACREMGMRCVQTSGINDYGPELERLEQLYYEINGKDPLNSFLLGFHAEYTCSKELLEGIVATVHKMKAPVYVHLAETKAETDECVERYGMTPGKFLDSIGMFEYGGGAYHCVHLTPEEIEIFKKKNLHVITNPGSNTKLASGIAPVSDFLQAGLNVAIGTDGAASNNCLDMFREMFLVTGLAKLRENDASAVEAVQVLKMATVNGANAMALTESDVLAKDKLADMIMIDMHQPNMQPMNNIVKNIVYSGSKQNVKMTMIHGKILYRDGIFHVGNDPEAIYEKANAIISRIRSAKP